jgi:hypothetical protein
MITSRERLRMNDALDPLPGWLRWVLVLPMAIIGFFAIQLMIIVISALNISWLSWLPDWVIQLINSAASGFAFVYAGAWMAPRGKLPVAVILTVAVAALSGMILLATLFGIGHGSRIVLLVATLLTLLFAVFACITVYDEDRKRPDSRYGAAAR